MVKLPKVVEAALDGEEPQVVLKARLPRKHTDADTWVTFHILIALFDWARNALRMRRAHVSSLSVGFPLYPKMLFVLTEHRLLVWKLGLPASAAAPTAIPRERVARVYAPVRSAVPRKWRSSSIGLTDGLSAWILLESEHADAFAAAFER